MKYVIVSPPHYFTASNGHTKRTEKQWFCGGNTRWSTRTAMTFDTQQDAEQMLARVQRESYSAYLSVEEAPQW